MSITVSVEPTEEPVTADEQQAWSRITDEAEGEHLEDLITGARLVVEAILQRSLCTQTIVERFDRFPCHFCLERGPVQSLASVKYYDVAGTLQTIASSNYFADLYSTPARIVPVVSYTWPIVQIGRPNAVEVTYVAGYGAAASVPRPIRMAISMLVDHWYENRAPVLVGSVFGELPLSVQSLLAPFRAYQ